MPRPLPNPRRLDRRLILPSGARAWPRPRATSGPRLTGSNSNRCQRRRRPRCWASAYGSLEGQPTSDENLVAARVTTDIPSWMPPPLRSTEWQRGARAPHGRRRVGPLQVPGGARAPRDDVIVELARGSPVAPADGARRLRAAPLCRIGRRRSRPPAAGCSLAADPGPRPSCWRPVRLRSLPGGAAPYDSERGAFSGARSPTRARPQQPPQPQTAAGNVQPLGL